MTLKIATHGPGLPDEFVTQSAAILARRGAGKTYAASVLMEEMIEAGLPVVAHDPLGVMFGLRSSANGRAAGLPVTIIGGEHGDVPLEPTGGAVVARFVVEHPGAFVIDLSGFDSNAQQDRFATDFAEALYRAKNQDRTALHLVVDEADSFAPQRPQRGQERMLGAYEAIVRRGRSRGLGVTLISQRPAVLNKNVLSQVEVLIAMQVTAPQDRAALDEWAKGYSTPEQRSAFLASLASLQTGEAWLWSPGWLDRFGKIKVRKRRTFDSSSTPLAGQERAEPSVLAPVDLDTLTAAMADTIERAAADDPKTLRRRIRELEAEVAHTRAEMASAPTAVETVEVEVVPRAVWAAVVEVVEAFNDTVAAVEAALRDGGSRINLAAAQIESVSGDTRRREVQPAAAEAAMKPSAEGSRTSPSDPGSTAPRGTDRPAPTRQTTRAFDTGYAPRAGARRMLEALAPYPAGLTAAQVATLAKVKRKGGTFSTYASELQRNGCITVDGSVASGWFRITEHGMDIIGGEPLPSDPAALRSEWRERLKAAGAKRMFDYLVATYPAWCSREQLADAASIELSGGTFSTYLSRLRSNGLIEEDPLIGVVENMVRAHPDLFLGDG